MRTHRHPLSSLLFLLLSLSPTLAAGGAAPPAAPAAAATTNEGERAFFQDGPAWLLPKEERERVLALDPPDRERYAREFLANDPLPATPLNELEIAVERRRQLVQRELLGFGDDRARLLFLRGKPANRETIECGQVYRPMELWTYGSGEAARHLVLYRPGPGRPFRLWLPTDGKRVLYIEEMEYLLEQWQQLRARLSGKRIDLRMCDKAATVDKVTGVGGIFDFARDRPTDAEVNAFVAPPADLGAWAREAAATPLPEHPVLPVSEARLSFPAARGQRLVARLLIGIPAGAPIVAAVEEKKPDVSAATPAPAAAATPAPKEAPKPAATPGATPAAPAPPAATEAPKETKRELRLAVEGRVEQGGQVFEEFRNRFVLPPGEVGGAIPPLALIVERALRPGEEFLLRVRVRDEVGGAEAYVSRAFTVPAEATPEVLPPVPEGTIVALTDQLAEERFPGKDSLLLVPPAEDVVFGLWRAEAIVTGERVRKVVFSVDGKAQVTKAAPPWSAELRLPNLPKEQVVRAEGLDEKGAVVVSDEVVLNQPQGEPKVIFLAPPRGARLTGEVTARAGVVVPEGHRVEQVEFRVNDQVVATLTQPPWETKVRVPEQGEVTFLTVTAIFSDGARAEDVRFLNVPQHLEQVEVNLVELYTTVLDGQGRPADGLVAEDFTVLDEGRPQKLDKFEQVVNLPLTLGIALDLSGSMQGSLAEAKRAAVGFLDSVLTPRDRCFAVGFSTRPELLMPPTADAKALEAAFAELPAVGMTALHDAIVFSLHYFRGTSGRRALVLLSDGDDTSSAVPFRDALEYARRSGVVIYTVGLDVGMGAIEVRSKLKALAEETGGRVFYISKATELAGVYDQIERELRSQYLLAFTPDQQGESGVFRKVEVKVKKSGLKARAARGYYP
ncbi:MAG: VWA domain-containing protein [Holophagales bacterium]|nr:MAG: VWA domain-containing protein [Holophagales bacterium]